MATVEPCPKCGAKPNACRIIRHRKGCDDLPETAAAPQPRRLECCNQPMIRTDGGSYDVMCRHNRLLTDECSECRQQRHGSLIFRCALCGSQVEDAPGRPSAVEATAAINAVRG